VEIQFRGEGEGQVMVTRRTAAVAVVVGLAGSATALLLAPTLMPDSYSWLAHTTSESAAQGVEGAWLARLGFVMFGLSVLLLAAITRRVWGHVGATLHAVFGLSMLATAAFSTRSWVPDAPYDPTVDTLHSIAASAIGFAFALGIVAVAVRARRAGLRRWWLLDLTALLASVLLPLGMLLRPDAAGLLQRSMFAIAYAWYVAESLRRPTGLGRGGESSLTHHVRGRAAGDPAG
jgi:hypothetical protein